MTPIGVVQASVPLETTPIPMRMSHAPAPAIATAASPAAVIETRPKYWSCRTRTLIGPPHYKTRPASIVRSSMMATPPNQSATVRHDQCTREDSE